MNFNEFKDLVNKKKAKNPIWFALNSDQKPDKSSILEAEDKLKAKLPDDYLSFINEYGGGYFAFSNVFSLDKLSDWNIVIQNETFDSFRKGHVLISDNGSGDFYGYKIVNGKCLPNIEFFDHEVQEWGSTEFSNLFEYLVKFGLTN